MDKFHKILIVQTAFIGDVILITPLIKAVSELFPKAMIDVMVIKETRTILLNNPHIRKIQVFDKRKNKTFAFLNMIDQLRKEHYDVVITPHSSFTTSLLLLLSGIPERIGFDRFTARHLLTKKVIWLKGKHRIINNLNLLSVFSDQKWDTQTELYPSEKDKTLVDKLLAGLHNKQNLIVIAPGSVWKTKCWEEQSYVELVKGLYHAGYSLIFTGSRTEADLCERIIRNAGIEALNLAGKTSILESAEVMRRCRLLICNDSGSLHLANAMKTDVYAFFGPTVKRLGYYPFREHDLIFEVDLPCRPCGSHGARICPEGHHNCMKLIQPDIVLAAVEKNYPIIQEKE
ncbi:MAG TPA: lipopolysaccharide heptosyltransferase II [Candidatus Cloacimonadota bacterium]|nr:lipopolysaccharide heptosyltransferase II [Candidatus Cloacimonadota bacterium]HPT71890.1 lipopolysaccharide heptosyltransferase II [Candidatus Cloacimonadota bacterium]